MTPELIRITTSNSPILFAALATLLSFILSNVVAMVYEKTFQGLSYSRTFVQAIILGSIVVCIAMQAIGDNVARGIGMFGALTLIRFRSSLKDPKDMIFIFASLAMGIACGVHAYVPAVVGCLVFSLASLAVFRSPFGRNTHFDGMLRFSAPSDSSSLKQIDALLALNCTKFALITMRDVGQGLHTEYAYQVKLRAKCDRSEFLYGLQNLPDVRGAQLLFQEATIEI